MLKTYTKKIIYSFNEAELYNYSNPVKYGYQTKCKSRKTITGIKQLPVSINAEKCQKSRKSLSEISSKKRAKTRFRRLVSANLDMNKFYTLTFLDNVTDLSTANLIFKKFIMRMRYRFGNFKYIVVPEFQVRGVVHYHLLCNLPFVSANFIQTTWGYGFIKVRRIFNQKYLAYYMMKYFLKSDYDVLYKKRFFCSRSIRKYVVLVGENVEWFLSFLSSRFKEVINKEFFSFWLGRISYSQFLIVDPAGAG